MKLFHVVPPGTWLAPHRGLIVERDTDTIRALYLNVAVRGRRPEAYVYNFGTRTGFKRPTLWVRLGWSSVDGFVLRTGKYL